jgi:dipeptidyl aminopeptidase/acylaminoacyl peptidase
MSNRSCRFGFRWLRLTTLLAVALASEGRGQQNGSGVHRISDSVYARAERMLGSATNPLVVGGTVRPNWLAGDRFWYRTAAVTGAEFILVDPGRRTRTPVFDNARLAAALALATGAAVDANQLPFQTIDINADMKSIAVEVGARRYGCDITAYRCVPDTTRNPTTTPEPPRNSSASPDGRLAAYIKDHNLWVREIATGRDVQLTTDGVKDFGYATNNAGWTKSDSPVLLWSPDSRKIATFQHDARGVGEMFLVSTAVGHPTLEAWKYPLPEDSVIFRIHRVIIDLGGATPRVIRLQMPPDQHRSTLCDHIVCSGQWADVEWTPDGSEIAFVSSSRDHKEARLRMANAATGAVRDVLEEKVETFFESGAGRVNWRLLPATNEVIWWSQRTDWGHPYLHDLATGKLRRAITTGNWNVSQIVRVDEPNRTIWFTGVGREQGRDPYFRHFYRVKLDGTGLTLLTPDDGDHTVTMSPSGRYLVDSWSKPDTPPVSVVRDADGKVILELERADISRLVATGWKPPIPFIVKARDGRTELHGLMFRPTNFDSTRRYPIINHIYPGPQTGSVGSRSFSPSRGDTQAIAELGFIVVQIDAMGTPNRSKSFHAAYYGNMGDNGLPDQIAGMQQLARRHRWIDLDRAGIYGHSGGGYAAADAMFRYPDFFKVGVSQAGNHDNRHYEDDWGEKWQGLLEKRADGTTTYDNQANQLVAKNLKGKLLIAHGSMDNNVPPNNSLLVVDELIRANKDFDFILFPNRRHGFGSEPYMMRRRWDYFVRHLLGAEPPAEYRLGGS